MSTENVVSFKVHYKPHHTGGDDADAAGGEVRRFTVERDVSSSLAYLVEKLGSVFPELRRNPVHITWQDEDGDYVTIGSDDELMIALTEMAGPVYRLTVSPKQGKSGRRQSGEGELHPNVTCDGCEKSVVGNRYKCLVCDDYDLCGECESAGCHPEHSMVRVVRPGDAAWTSQVLRNMRRRHWRAAAAGEAASDPTAEFGCPAWGGGGRWSGMGSGGRNRMAGRRGFGCRNLGAGGVGGWGPIMEALVQGWTGGNMPASGQEAATAAAAAHESAHAAAQAAHNSAHAAAQAAHNSAHSAAHSASKAAHDAAMTAAAAAAGATNAAHVSTFSGADYLKNVGNFVAAALDPFGIDVLVEIENAMGERQKVGGVDSNSASASTSEEKKAEQQENSAEHSAEAPVVVQEERPVEPVSGNVEPEKSKSPTPSDGDESEWTMVPTGDKKGELVTSSSSSTKTVEIPIQVVESPAQPLPVTPKIAYVDPAGTIYPQLPATDPTPMAATPVPSAPAATVNHPDPRIQVALQAMINMGFSNEGGWLATLLEAKNGDIGKVLDVLQPVKK